DANYVNKNLEYAGRVADYLEFAELLTIDALHRTESCGGHFREESQTPDGEALRDDERFSYVAAWEYNGVGQAPTLHEEPLVFEYVTPTPRRYKCCAATFASVASPARTPKATSRTTRSSVSRRTCRSSRCSPRSTKT